MIEVADATKFAFGTEVAVVAFELVFDTELEVGANEELVEFA